MCKFLKNGFKKMKWYDIGFIKWSTFFGTLFLITVWPAFANFVLGYDWYWYLIICLALALVPMKRMFFD